MSMMRLSLLFAFLLFTPSSADVLDYFLGEPNAQVTRYLEGWEAGANIVKGVVPFAAAEVGVRDIVVINSTAPMKDRFVINETSALEWVGFVACYCIFPIILCMILMLVTCCCCSVRSCCKVGGGCSPQVPVPKVKAIFPSIFFIIGFILAAAGCFLAWANASKTETAFLNIYQSVGVAIDEGVLIVTKVSTEVKVLQGNVLNFLESILPLLDPVLELLKPVSKIGTFMGVLIGKFNSLILSLGEALTELTQIKAYLSKIKGSEYSGLAEKIPSNETIQNIQNEVKGYIEQYKQAYATYTDINKTAHEVVTNVFQEWNNSKAELKMEVQDAVKKIDDIMTNITTEMQSTKDSIYAGPPSREQVESQSGNVTLLTSLLNALSILWMLPGLIAIILAAVTRPAPRSSHCMKCSFVLMYMFFMLHVIWYVVTTGLAYAGNDMCTAIPIVIDEGFSTPLTFEGMVLESPKAVLECQGETKIFDLITLDLVDLNFTALVNTAFTKFDEQINKSDVSGEIASVRSRLASFDGANNFVADITNGVDFAAVRSKLVSGRSNLTGFNPGTPEFDEAQSKLANLSTSAGQTITLDNIDSYEPSPTDPDRDALLQAKAEIVALKNTIIGEINATIARVDVVEVIVNTITGTVADVLSTVVNINATLDEVTIGTRNISKLVANITNSALAIVDSITDITDHLTCGFIGDFYKTVYDNLCVEALGGLAYSSMGEFLVWFGMFLAMFTATFLWKYLKGLGNSITPTGNDHV